MFTEKKCSNESRKSLKWIFVIFGNLSKKLVYFWISRQKSAMEGGEVGTFSKVPDWKNLFLLNKTQAKVKQNPGCPNKDIFKHQQNIRVYPKSKKSALINDYENIVAYSEQFEQSEAVDEQVWFVLNLIWGSEGWCHPRKMWLILLWFKRGNSIPSTPTRHKIVM